MDLNFMHSSSSAHLLNHPRLTNLIYKNVSQPSATHSYNGRALVLPRGTLGFIEFAKIVQQNRQTDSSDKELSLFEKAPKVIQEKIFSFLDPVSRSNVLETASLFHKVKEASLRERNDLVQKFLQKIDFDLSTLSACDLAVLKEIGPSITSLIFSNTALTKRLQEFVSLFPNLRELNFNIWLFNNEHLAVLEPLKNLSSLSLAKCLITDHGLEVLLKFPRLKKLSVESQHITDTGIRLLGRLSKLEFLSLSREYEYTNDGTPARGITQETLKELGQNLKNLRTLRLTEFISDDGKDYGNEVLTSLSFFTNLEELIIDNHKEVLADPCYEAIGKLHKLRNLKIGCNSAHEKALEELSKLTQLQKLDIDPPDCKKKTFAKFLLSFSQLTDLTLRSFEFEPDDIHDFPEDQREAQKYMKDLLDREKVEGEDLFGLIAKNCPQLKRLSFLDLFTFTGKKFAELTTLAQLERLEFADMGFLQSTILESLNQFQKLRTVVISNCLRITDKDIENAKATHKKLPIIEYTPPDGSWTPTSDCDISESDTDNDNRTASAQTSVKIHEQNSLIFKDIFSPRIQTYIP